MTLRIGDKIYLDKEIVGKDHTIYEKGTECTYLIQFKKNQDHFYKVKFANGNVLNILKDRFCDRIHNTEK